MTDQARNIAINVRTAAKKHLDEPLAPPKAKPVHKKTTPSSEARVISVSHSEVPNTPRVEIVTETTPAVFPDSEGVEALVPSRMSIPKKPMLVEDIAISSLSVAYFCMEMGLESDIPTYAGGLGILAGDMMKSCADLDVPVVGVSLLYRKGYFKQRLDHSGWQFEEDDFWDPRQHMIPLAKEVAIELEGRKVHVRAWMYKLQGAGRRVNPIIFLDTDIEGNSDEDKLITARLYSGDARYRLLQEAVLGIGGLRILGLLGATNIQKFHMNEGHSALLTIELYRQYSGCDDPLLEVSQRTVFTTHTPVAAGHDIFAQDLALSVLGVHFVPSKIEQIVFKNNVLHMTELALQLSGYVNGVAKRHGEVTRQLFPGYTIESITNGVHAGAWVGSGMARLFDHYLPGWKNDPYNLRYALSIPIEDLWQAHMDEKRALIKYVNETHDAKMDADIFTIGFARRATRYKRGNMLFSDIERLKHIAEKGKGIQIIYAGKAHPHDHEGKLLIQEIIRNMGQLGEKVRCVYLENYDMKMAKRLVAGVDLWLNTPTRPQEASGTSGMKAALNGVPQFSILDGWWIEGHIEGVTGYSIGAHPEDGVRPNADAEDIEDMYTKLEYLIIPRFENEHDRWVKMMRQSIAVNGSFFNTHRMVSQYVLSAYFK